MLKQRKVKAIYINVGICNKCGSELAPTGMCLTTWPAQYPYKCTNPDCDGQETFWEDNKPGHLRYEFEEEMDICTTLLP